MLRRKLQRERAAREQAEQLLEHKSLELFERNKLLEQEVRVRLYGTKIRMLDHSSSSAW